MNSLHGRYPNGSFREYFIRTFSGIIIGSRYQQYVQTGTSTLAFSILMFVLTAPLWIWITRMVV